MCIRDSVSTIFPIIIQTFLWNYLYGHGDAGAMTGYSYSQIMVYTLLAGMVSKLVYTGFEYAVNEDIKTGGLNKYLVRPEMCIRDSHPRYLHYRHGKARARHYHDFLGISAHLELKLNHLFDLLFESGLDPRLRKTERVSI